MKKHEIDKIDKLNELSRNANADAEAKWKRIAEWNNKHAESLEDFTIIALRIGEALRHRQMTQKELAHNLGVQPQALTRIIKGRQNLTLQTIRKIEKELGITLISIHRHTQSASQT